MTPIIILGCGYVGTRIARAALAAGRTVRVCGRASGRMAPLGELGAQVKYLDAAVPKQLPVALASLHGATVVYSPRASLRSMRSFLSYASAIANWPALSRVVNNRWLP